MSDAPMASGASVAPLRTAMPTVNTRKNVPMNSTRYFFMGGGGGWKADAGSAIARRAKDNAICIGEKSLRPAVESRVSMGNSIDHD